MHKELRSFQISLYCKEFGAFECLLVYLDKFGQVILYLLKFVINQFLQVELPQPTRREKHCELWNGKGQQQNLFRV